MEKKATITSAQLLLILIWSRLMLTYTFMPVIFAPPKNQDVWVVAILSALYLILISLPLLYLRNRFPGISAVRITQDILGSVPGGAVVIVFAALCFFCFTSCVLMDVVFINSSIFQATPPWAILCFILVPVAYTAYHGIGTIGRISIFIVPYIILTVLMFFLMGIKDMDLNVLKPILADSSMADLNKGAFLNASINSEMLLFFIYGAYLKKGARVGRIFLLDVCLHLLLMLVMVVPTMCTLGADLARHVWNPYYVYVKQIKAYEFLYRMESLSVLAWFLGSLLRSALFCYAASALLTELFRVKKSNRLVIPASILVFAVVMIPAVGNSETMRKIASYQVLPYIMLPAILLLPLVMLLVLGIKRLIRRPREDGADDG